MKNIHTSLLHILHYKSFFNNIIIFHSLIFSFINKPSFIDYELSAALICEFFCFLGVFFMSKTELRQTQFKADTLSL